MLTAQMIYGQGNGHSMGIVLKEIVRRAMATIRQERMIFEANPKRGYNGEMDDVFTSADTKAQKVCLRSLRECFPHIGIVAEEDALQIESAPGLESVYFTIDPLDGTKAFVRKQSHGVGTMISLVVNGEVVSAYVGDVNTIEIYGFRPESSKVHRINSLDNFETLDSGPRVPLEKHHILLREDPTKYSPLSQELIGNLKSILVDGGSIGTWMARLWKREVPIVMVPPCYETPWDLMPVMGISKRLGYLFLKPLKVEKQVLGWTFYSPTVSKEKYWRDHDAIIIHRDDLASLASLTTVTCGPSRKLVTL